MTVDVHTQKRYTKEIAKGRDRDAVIITLETINGAPSRLAITGPGGATSDSFHVHLDAKARALPELLVKALLEIIEEAKKEA